MDAVVAAHLFIERQEVVMEDMDDINPVLIIKCLDKGEQLISVSRERGAELAPAN